MQKLLKGHKVLKRLKFQESEFEQSNPNAHRETKNAAGRMY